MRLVGVRVFGWVLRWLFAHVFQPITLVADAQPVPEWAGGGSGFSGVSN
ncbi:hypothetical protein FM101_15540 [Arthrobacter rhombi]|uniref:Uncharacterized protein n=1 Tax=Arthrobacter rhombi TaxID=71253 RepID=A0A1R4GWU3_9MICC|nr:hypothetical protein FM101_15540 [Arthrobacter rhombi]